MCARARAGGFIYEGCGVTRRIGLDWDTGCVALDGIRLRRRHGGGRPREWPAITTADFISGGARASVWFNKTVCAPVGFEADNIA